MNFNTLVEAVAHWAEHTPDKVCLIEADTDRKMTYIEFWQSARVLARRLGEVGIRKGDRVVVRVTQTIETLVTAFGIYLAGGIYVPLAKNIGNHRISEALQYFDTRYYIASTPIEENCIFFDINAVCEEEQCDDLVNYPDPDDVSDIFFTTGTTGLPKGVMRSFNSYCATAEAWNRSAGITSSVVFASNSPQNLVAGIGGLQRSLFAGGTHVIGNGIVFLHSFFQTIQKCGVTSLFLNQTELSILLNAQDALQLFFQKVDVIILGAAKANFKDLKVIKELLPNTRILSVFNATETSSICTYEFLLNSTDSLCVGKPDTGVEVLIMNDAREFIESSYQNPGLIACKSPTIMKGYWNNPELTVSVLNRGWLILGDVGYADKDGFVYFMGRKDEIINSGGHKIAPIEIEKLTLEVFGVAECACVPVPDAIMGSVPKLFVVMEKDIEFSAKNIREHLLLRLEAYKLPRIIVSIDALPKTDANMKINKKRLV